MTTHVLSPGVAAAVPVKACHRCDRTNFKHLAEYIAGRLPSTLSTSSVISQHRVPLALSGEVRFVPIWNPFTYLCFLKFRNSYYVRSRFLHHVNNDRFDRRCAWLFHPLFFFPRSFLHPHAFGGSGNGSLRRFSSGKLCCLACLTLSLGFSVVLLIASSA